MLNIRYKTASLFLMSAKKEAYFSPETDSSSFNIQLYSLETLLPSRYCDHSECSWIASKTLFKFSTEMLSCFETTS